MSVHILEHPFNPWQAITDHQQQSSLDKQFGATATFIGTMRDFNNSTNVSQMVLEHYAEMTQHYLGKLELAAKKRWGLLDSLIIHRVGTINPADPIVLIACWSAHRRAALDACNWLIEELKHNAPLWKKEISLEGEHWLERNTDGT